MGIGHGMVKISDRDRDSRDVFVCQANIVSFVNGLNLEKDQQKRSLLERLLAEERAKLNLLLAKSRGERPSQD